MSFSNPVITGFNPDPSICRVGKDYFLVTSSFEFFPGIPIYHSSNLVNWELIGYVASTKEHLDLTNVGASCGLWAPTIRYHEGIFYVCVTLMNGNRDTEKDLKQLLFKTNDIYGVWDMPIILESIDGIDPSITFEDNKTYIQIAGFYNNQRGIFQWEADLSSGKMITKPVHLTDGSEGMYSEGPHIYKIDNKYYLLTAEGGTFYGHLEACFRSDSPYGPFEKCPHNPILTHRHVILENGLQSTGHADLIQDHTGKWWLVFLATRGGHSGLHHLGRETSITPVEWIDGWPVIPNNGMVPVDIDAKTPDIFSVQEPNDLITAFKGSLPNRFNYIRTPDENNYVQTDNGLLLRGSIKLSDPYKSPTFIGVRQGEYKVTAAAEVKLVEAGAAGITAFYNDSYYYSMSLEKQEHVTYIRLVRQIHDINVVTAQCPIEADTVKMRIRADQEWYYFEFAAQEDWTLLGKARVAGLSSEAMFEMTFTGVFLGLFCEQGTAVFKNFEYRELFE